MNAKVADLRKDIDIYSVEASKKSTFESMKLCLEKANSCRSMLKKKEQTLIDLEKAIVKLEEEIKKC